MFRISGQKGVHALNLFNWKRHSTTSLTTGLLNDEPHEIELSDYHKAPSHCSESPSGFLDGEILNSEPIDDLDLFFERVYNYYCEKGLWCIIIKWVFELLSLAFTICFSGFFLLYVDWNGLRNAKCGMDAIESGIKPCDLSKEALHEHPLTPFTLSKAIIVGYLGIFSIYWIFCFLRFFAQLKETLKIRRFYYNSLHVTDNEIQTMPWSSILEKVVQVQHSQKLCVVKDLSIHDVVMRLMRKENYLIGMLNKGVLSFPMSWWVPGAGTTINVGLNAAQHRLVLPKTLEWTLNWCILQSMFDRNFCIRRDFVSDPNTLKKRLMIVGFALLLLSPFLVDHLFKHRMNSSIAHASDYLKQFPSPILSIVAKFISFVSGGFAAVLIIIAFLEESLLEGHIFGRNLFWYAAVFGTITAISRAAMMDELLVLDPQGAMTLVVQHTHYMPKKWRGKEHTETVRLEFETLFQYTGMMLMEEMASIFLTPYLLLFVVPKRVDDILQFIMDFTVDVEGVGHICSFSLFNFKNHGNRKYGSTYNSPCDRRSSQGKMEKSFLSFQIAYPSWEPNPDGKQFLKSLKKFRDQKLPGHHHRTNSPNYQNRNSFLFSREKNSTTSSPRNFRSKSESTWLIEVEHKNFPYILDWYYTSQNHDREEEEENPTTPSRNYENAPKDDFWTPPPNLIIRPNPKYDENWDDDEDDPFEDRRHLEASTSAPLFQESFLQHHEPDGAERPARSQWWARTRLQGPGPQTSFLEPPVFYREASREIYENFSDRSMEEEQELELGNSKIGGTFYMDDLGGGDFNLPFDDIYGDRLEDLAGEETDPANLVTKHRSFFTALKKNHIPTSNLSAMRRASSKLLPHLKNQHRKHPTIPPFCADFFTSSDHSLPRHPKSHQNKPFSETQSPLYPNLGLHGFRPGPSRNFSTLVGPIAQNGPQVPSRQRKIMERADLEEAFESAESIDEMLEAFKAMETTFEEKDLGLACLKIGLKLDKDGEDPEKALSFAQRALRIFDDCNDSNSDRDSGKNMLSLPIAMTLQLLGSSSFNLKRFNDSLGYLIRANRVLAKCEAESSVYRDEQILPILHAVQQELFNVKTAMGRREEAIVHLKKSLEIKERTLDEDSKELGKANRDMAEAYVAVLNFKEALPFCLKALDMHKEHLGHNSVEVAYDRRLLGIIYTGLEDHEKALEQNQLSRKVLKKWGRDSDLLRAEIDAANMQIALGRHEEAFNTLKGIVQQTEKESEDRAMVFAAMAKALCNQENFPDAKKCLDIACGIYDKKIRTSPDVVAEAFTEISTLYETMNEFETAISLLRKTLAMLEKLPQEQHSVGSVLARIGWLLLLTGKVEQAVSVLEDAAERLKESFGSNHYGVGYVYNNLGAAYLELDRPQSAAQVFAYAKEIMDVALGPHHVDSIEACQNLSKAYAAMGSYPLAINFQEDAVEGLERHGPSVQDELDEAVRVLGQLKEKASAQVSEALLKDFPIPEGEELFQAKDSSALERKEILTSTEALFFSGEVSNGPSAQEELVEAVRLLEHLKEREARMKAFTAPEKDDE
ncbi:autophagy 9 family protein [Striga asiatica]|uniref:Autophagy-related protein 9 n=1 Tax=Striga asiatica TaxID=4170 RepID=A0A5A7PAD4_STRAF|nr:autophagy 9 family protein [Striga asiatica]